MEPYIQKVNQENTESETDINGHANSNKLVILRTTKKKVSSSQLTTLLGGEKKLKEFMKATNMQEIYAGVDIVAVEVSVVKSVDQQKGLAMMELIQQEMRNLTGINVLTLMS
jgi:hypothetical protein